MPTKASPSPQRSKAAGPLSSHPHQNSAAGAAAAGAVPQGGTEELTSYVQGLLQQMQSRFEEMSTSIVSRIDEVTARIDELEGSIDTLMQQCGTEETNDSVSGK